jgi:hypothetical protein
MFNGIKRRHYILLFFFACFGSGVKASVLSEAQDILHSLKSTSYTHEARVDVSRGIYDFDCSSFATYVLNRSAPEAARELEASTAPKRPLARDFANFFSSPPGNAKVHWESVASLHQLIAGDIVAWLIPVGSLSKDTGHVMIVSGDPYPNSKNPGEWLIPVIDAAVSGHGKTDPRRKAGPNGVGSGVVGFIQDEQGMPIAFRWSGGESKEIHSTTIRMARPR